MQLTFFQLHTYLYRDRLHFHTAFLTMNWTMAQGNNIFIFNLFLLICARLVGPEDQMSIIGLS